MGSRSANELQSADFEAIYYESTVIYSQMIDHAEE